MACLAGGRGLSRIFMKVQSSLSCGHQVSRNLTVSHKRYALQKVPEVDPMLSVGDVPKLHSEELSYFQKRILVSTKMYPDLASIPDRIPLTKIKTGHDKFRVKVATWLVLGTLFVCGCVMVQGNRDQKLHGVPPTNWDEHVRNTLKNLPENKPK